MLQGPVPPRSPGSIWVPIAVVTAFAISYFGWVRSLGFRRGLFVIATGDGMLHVARVVLASRPERQIEVLRSFPGRDMVDGEDLEPPILFLSSDEQTMAVRQRINVSDGVVDDAISLFAVETGELLLFTGDDGRPDHVFRGTDRNAPDELRRAQGRADRLHRRLLRSEPDRVRPIVTARWDEGRNGSEAEPRGWTTAGQLLVTGACRVGINENSAHEESGRLSEWPRWWQLFGPQRDGTSWQLVREGIGGPPMSRRVPRRTRIVLRRAPPRDTRVSLSAPIVNEENPDEWSTRILIVNGDWQAGRQLASGVVSFDGPFLS